MRKTKGLAVFTVSGDGPLHGRGRGFDSLIAHDRSTFGLGSPHILWGMPLGQCHLSILHGGQSSTTFRHYNNNVGALHVLQIGFHVGDGSHPGETFPGPTKLAGVPVV